MEEEEDEEEGVVGTQCQSLSLLFQTLTTPPFVPCVDQPSLPPVVIVVQPRQCSHYYRFGSRTPPPSLSVHKSTSVH